MTSMANQQKPAQPAKKLTAQELVDLAATVEPAELAKLSRIGVNFAPGLAGDNLDAAAEWGYWCPHCNGISMYFKGRGFGPDGASPAPLAGTPIDLINWFQPGVPPERVNRHRPLCQGCGAQVALGPGRTLLTGASKGMPYIRRIQDHEAVLDQHFTTAAKREVRAYIDEAASKADIGDAAQNYDLDTKASDLLTDGQKDVIAEAVEAGAFDGPMDR